MSTTNPMHHYGDNFIPVIPVDKLIHTDEHPFCTDDPSCICHEDPDNIARVHQFYLDGFVTADEATTIVKGKTLH